MVKTFYFSKNKNQIFIDRNLKAVKLATVGLIILIFPACLNTPEETTPTHKNVGASAKSITKIYQNELFWEVTVDKLDNNKYSVKGKGKNSISHFNYVVEDGHNQLLNNTAQLNQSNPEWRTFNFIFEVQKKDKNTTLILALFEKPLENLKTNVNKNHTMIIPLD